MRDVRPTPNHRLSRRESFASIFEDALVRQSMFHDSYRERREVNNLCSLALWHKMAHFSN